MVSWTIDTRDWEPGATTVTITDAMANVHDQDIVLLHDGYDTTVNAVPDIARLLKAKGLCSVSGKLANAQTPIVSGSDLRVCHERRREPDRVGKVP